MYLHQQGPAPSPYGQYQGGYPSSSYSHHHAPPVRQASPVVDPNGFRNWFNSHLATLTVNNKVIIHQIAFIAREHAQHYADVVAHCIELHIRKVPPSIKLPPFYLLDSISKNIGRPYTGLFSAFIAPLFLDTYHVVDIPTRGKMEEMLVTWRTGGPGGVELFGREAQMSIEARVWGNGAQQASSDLDVASSGPSRSQVLTELEVILAQKTRAVEINPNDTLALGHVDVLRQLRHLVQNSAVSPAELAAILTQLRTLARTIASTAPPMAPMPPPPQPVYPPSAPSFSTPPQQAYPAMAPSEPPVPATGVNGLDLSSILSMVSQPAASVPAPAPLAPAAAAPTATPDISGLFRSLVKAGIVTDTITSSATNSPKPQAATVQLGQASSSMNHVTQAEAEYEEAILSLHVQLSATGIHTEQLDAVSLLYDRLPLVCKQCAQRFPEDAAGKKRMEDHLDLHFRQNRKASQQTGRGHSRSWFVGIEDWVHDSLDTSPSAIDKGKGRADLPVLSAKANAEREAKLRESYVVIPPGEEAKRITCPVCKESLKSEFLEEDEEWVWRNATSVKGKIYHATCHADALSTSVAARLRGQTHARSRSGTPDGQSNTPQPRSPTRSDDGALNNKRKAEDDDPYANGVSVKLEPSSTPPMKKLALSL
ncbi:hypothetical protein BOTBODRAFT_26732 [Botryobasidium botryosum FD-172 SS1]|uniref:CID domain-containing protein n=1 Tax=Botryobasidium botryosum (strain FD-172 SS1) TaxID=930990 RepID=A0A067MY81_BOTB1|nr:hypothetical protein BOTBODRAFT_26732 [Botryobasidium botryosum FD-172 SS1]